MLQTSSLMSVSSAETKVLNKTISLAQLLAARHNKFNKEKDLNANSRFKLLLLALVQVSKALSLVDKVIGVSDRFIELVKLLSNFTFSQASQLLGDSRWVSVVEKKVRIHQLKKQWGKWRSARRGILTGFQNFRLIDHKPKGKPFYREFLGQTSFDDMILKPTMQAQSPLMKAFSKWRLCARDKLVVDCKKTETLQRLLRVWHKQSMLKRIYENYTGTSYFGFSERSLAQSMLREWRGASKLQRHRVSDINYTRRSTMEGWRVKLESKLARYQLGILFDSTRHLRPTFVIWFTFANKCAFGREKSCQHDRKRILTGAIEKWRMKRQRVAILNTYLGRWRGSAEFQHKNYIQAHVFDLKKAIVKSFNIWRHKSVSQVYMRQAGEKMMEKRSIRFVRIFFNVWREMHRWMGRSSDKVRTVRAAKDARNYLILWRGWREQKQAADTIYRTSLARQVMRSWIDKFLMTREYRGLRSNCFSSWKLLLSTRMATRRFATIKSALPDKIGWERIIDVALVKNSFSLWHRQYSLSKQADFYTFERQQRIKSDILKGWRMHTNVSFYIKQKPWRLQKRIFKKMRSLTGMVNEKERLLTAKLDDHLIGRDYVCYYRGFERWQQTFQERKMEEHLCAENLKYYNSIHQRGLLKVWKLITAEKMLVRYKVLNKKQAIVRAWHADAVEVTKGRRKRLLSRFIVKWRQNYRESVVKHLIKDKNRKSVRLILTDWRYKARKQKDLHGYSTEFIGISGLRYYLQRWRMETTLRLYNKSHVQVRLNK